MTAFTAVAWATGLAQHKKKAFSHSRCLCTSVRLRIHVVVTLHEENSENVIRRLLVLHSDLDSVHPSRMRFAIECPHYAERGKPQVCWVGGGQETMLSEKSTKSRAIIICRLQWRIWQSPTGRQIGSSEYSLPKTYEYLPRAEDNMWKKHSRQPVELLC